jgi:hypothetical protein
MEETEKLNTLFDAVADELLTKIKSGEAKPADLAVAVKFLKDNNTICISFHRESKLFCHTSNEL